MKALSDEIKELDVKVKDLDEEIRKELLSIPNTPNKSPKTKIDNKTQIPGRPTEFPTTRG